MKSLRSTLLILQLWPTAAVAVEQPERLSPDPKPLPARVHCPVDGEPVDDGRFVVLWHGRHYFMDRDECVRMFMGNPEAYARKVEPRAALFSAPHPSRPTFGPNLFYFGLYVVLGILSGGITAYVAVQKGLNARTWFFAGLLANVIAVAMVATCRGQEILFRKKGLCKTPQTYEPVPCPNCGRSNHPSATRCAGCDHLLAPTVSSEVARV